MSKLNNMNSKDVENLNQYLGALNRELAPYAWTHPRTLILITVLSEIFNYKSFAEIGSWVGAVPVMLKKLEGFLEIDQVNDFMLIENFEDHKSMGRDFPVKDPDSLTNFIKQQVSSAVEITVQNNLNNLRGSFDVVHFDSVKWQTELLNQFETIYQHTHDETLFVFDDYMAEWPDVIYCVNKISVERGLAIVASFGPKIYLGSPNLKDAALSWVNKSVLAHRVFNVRETIQFGLVISSGPLLMNL